MFEMKLCGMHLLPMERSIGDWENYVMLNEEKNIERQIIRSAFSAAEGHFGKSLLFAPEVLW
jgi:hypothetical protein